MQTKKLTLKRFSVGLRGNDPACKRGDAVILILKPQSSASGMCRGAAGGGGGRRRPLFPSLPPSSFPSAFSSFFSVAAVAPPTCHGGERRAEWRRTGVSLSMALEHQAWVFRDLCSGPGWSQRSHRAELHALASPILAPAPGDSTNTLAEKTRQGVERSGR